MNENKNGRRLEKATRREVLPLVVIFGILAVLSIASLVLLVASFAAGFAFAGDTVAPFAVARLNACT